MPQPHELNPSHLHLLGRAASQVVVHFGRYELEPIIRLDFVHGPGVCLRVNLREEPDADIVLSFFALEWVKYFDMQEVSCPAPGYALSITPHT